MTHRTRIKLCGLTRPEDIRAAVAAGADAIGFVFYPPSPRHVSAEQAARLLKELPAFISSVGLFVNADLDQVRQVLATAPISMLQFHGDETQSSAPVSPKRSVARSCARSGYGQRQSPQIC